MPNNTTKLHTPLQLAAVCARLIWQKRLYIWTGSILGHFTSFIAFVGSLLPPSITCSFPLSKKVTFYNAAFNRSQLTKQSNPPSLRRCGWSSGIPLASTACGRTSQQGMSYCICPKVVIRTILKGNQHKVVLLPQTKLGVLEPSIT